MTTALRSIPDPLAAGRLERAAAWVHLGAWAARVEVLALDDATALASYPAAVAKKLGVDAAWRPVLVKHAPDLAERAMPSFSELSAGLDAMLE